MVVLSYQPKMMLHIASGPEIWSCSAWSLAGHEIVLYGKRYLLWLRRVSFLAVWRNEEVQKCRCKKEKNDKRRMNLIPKYWFSPFDSEVGWFLGCSGCAFISQAMQRHALEVRQSHAAGSLGVHGGRQETSFVDIVGAIHSLPVQTFALLNVQTKHSCRDAG